MLWGKGKEMKEMDKEVEETNSLGLPVWSEKKEVGKEGDHEIGIIHGRHSIDWTKLDSPK